MCGHTPNIEINANFSSKPLFNFVQARLSCTEKQIQFVPINFCKFFYVLLRFSCMLSIGVRYISHFISSHCAHAWFSDNCPRFTDDFRPATIRRWHDANQMLNQCGTGDTNAYQQLGCECGWSTGKWFKLIQR